MQKLRHREVDVPAYHFGVQNIIGVSSFRVNIMVHPISKYALHPSTIMFLSETFTTVSLATQTDTICRGYAPRKLKYQLTTSKFAKLLSFHQICSPLCHTIYKYVVYYLFSIVILSKTFPKVSQATQTEIVYKSYSTGKLTYQLTTLGFMKLLAFHLLY